MSTHIPTPDEVRQLLNDISYSDCERVARMAGVPVPSVINVRNGKSQNPQLSLARAIWGPAQKILRANKHKAMLAKAKS
jgi:hypothetical protein